MTNTQTESCRSRFLKEFVNTHNDDWRPLRGLWHEEVMDFISNERKLLLEEVKGLVEIKKKKLNAGTALLERSWYNQALDDLLSALTKLQEKE